MVRGGVGTREEVWGSEVVVEVEEGGGVGGRGGCDWVCDPDPLVERPHRAIAESADPPMSRVGLSSAADGGVACGEAEATPSMTAAALAMRS